MASWLALFAAGLCECGWPIGMKFTAGFTRLWPSVATLVLMGLSVYLLSVAVKALPIGTAYAVWTGIGAVMTAILGMILFHEPATIARIVCILLVVSGIVGLVVLERPS